jgi:hypothetical protein
VARFSHATEKCERRIAISQRCVAAGPEGEDYDDTLLRCYEQLGSASRCMIGVLYDGDK